MNPRVVDGDFEAIEGPGPFDLVVARVEEVSALRDPENPRYRLTLRLDEKRRVRIEVPLTARYAPEDLEGRDLLAVRRGQRVLGLVQLFGAPGAGGVIAARQVGPGRLRLERDS